MIPSYSFHIAPHQTSAHALLWLRWVLSETLRFLQHAGTLWALAAFRGGWPVWFVGCILPARTCGAFAQVPFGALAKADRIWGKVWQSANLIHTDSHIIHTDSYWFILIHSHSTFFGVLRLSAEGAVRTWGIGILFCSLFHAYAPRIAFDSRHQHFFDTLPH